MNLKTQTNKFNERNYITRDEIISQIYFDTANARLCAEIVGYALNVKEDLLKPTRGNARNAFARQLAMYLTHVGFGMSLSRVANAFGRDRSTIAYACHLIEDRRDDVKFDDFVDNLQDAILNIPKPDSFN